MFGNILDGVRVGMLFSLALLALLIVLGVAL